MISQIGLPQLAGTAAGTVVSVTPVNAELLACYIANNSEGTVTLATTSPAPVTIMTMDAAGTQWFYPRVPTSTAGTAAGTIVLADYAALPVAGYVQLSANAGGTVNVTLLVQ